MREGVTSSLQEWLLEKRIDIAILHNPPHLETLDIAPILLERMLVIGPPKQHIKDGPHPASFRIRNLGELPLILPNMAHNNRRLVEQAAIEHGLRLRIKIEADSVAFAKALVEQGLGYTILTYAVVQEELMQERLTAYPIVRPTLSTQVSLVTLRDARRTKLIGAASEMLHDVCRTVVRGGGWSGAQLC
jgi:LysR family nitrogen assimilation transcriptional regulator